MIPNVICLCVVIFQLLVALLAVAARAKTDAIEQAEDQHQTTPPDRRMQIRKHNVCELPRRQFVEAVAKYHRSVDREKDPDKEPYGDVTGMHYDLLPEGDVECE